MSDEKPYVHKLHSVVHLDECPRGASYSEYVYLAEYLSLQERYNALEAELKMQDEANDILTKHLAEYQARIAALEAEHNEYGRKSYDAMRARAVAAESLITRAREVCREYMPPGSERLDKLLEMFKEKP